MYKVIQVAYHVMLMVFLLYYQLSIPEDLDDITTGLVNAIDRAIDNEDQSEQNLNLILKIMRNIADFCRTDNVSAQRYVILLNSVLFHNTQCTLNSNHLLNIVMALDLLQYWREEVLHLQSARYYSSLYRMKPGAHILCLYTELSSMLKKYTLSLPIGYSY